MDNRHLLHKVLVLGGHADNALAALVLRGVGVRRLTLDVARVREGNHAVVLFNQVFQQNVVLCRHDIGAACVGIFAADFGDFGFDNLFDLAHIGKNLAILFNLSIEFVQLVLDFLPFQPGQFAHGHIHDCLRLHLGEPVFVLQILFCRGDGLGMTEQIHDLVDIVARDFIALQNMRARLCLFQVEFGAADNHILLVGDVVVENLREREHFRLSVHQRQHIDGAGVLQLGVFVKLIEDDLPVCVPAVMNHNVDPVSAVGNVLDIGNAVNFLVLHQPCNRLHQHAFVDLVRDFGNVDDVFILVDMALGAHHHAPAPGFVCLDNAVYAVAGCRGGKVRPFDKLHQLLHGALRVLHAVDGGVDNLP